MDAGVLSRSRGLVAFGVVLAAGAIPLATAPGWLSQTELPKRLLAGLLGFSLLGLTALRVAPRAPERAVFAGPVPAFLGLVILWNLISTSGAESPVVGLEALVRDLLAPAWMLLGAAAIAPSARTAKAATTVLGLAVALVSAIALVQYGEIRPGGFPFGGAAGEQLLERARALLALLGLGGLDQTDAPGSVFTHANLGAEFVAFALPLLVGAALAGLARGGVPRLLGVGGLLLVTPLALLHIARAGSRGALLALIGAGVLAWGVGALATALRRPLFGSRSWHLGVHGAVLLTVLGSGAWLASAVEVQPRHGQVPTSLLRRIASTLDPESTTVRERLDLWGNTLAMASDRPVRGVGPGHFRITYPAYAEARRLHEPGRLSIRRQPVRAHLDALQRLAEVGLPGLLLWIAAVAAALVAGARLVLRRIRREGGNWIAPLGGLAALAATGAVSLVSFPFQQPATLVGFWCVAGWLVGSELRERATPARSPGAALVRGLAVLALAIFAVFVFHARAEAGASRDHRRAREAGVVAATGSDLAARRTALLRQLRLLDAAVRRRPGSDLLALERADALRRLGRQSEADAEYRRALEIHPRLINAWVGLARIALERGDLLEARPAARRAVALNPREPAARLVLAEVDDRQGFDERALEGFREALALEPTEPDRLRAFVGLATAASRRGDPLGAAWCLDEARRIAPGHPAVLQAEARVLERQAPGSAPSREAWRRVVETDSGDVEARLRLGIAELAAGRVAAAIEQLAAAAEASPVAVEPLFHLGRALLAANRLAEANAVLVEAMRRAGRPGGDPVIFERAYRMAESIQRGAREAAPGR